MRHTFIHHWYYDRIYSYRKKEHDECIVALNSVNSQQALKYLCVQRTIKELTPM